LPKQTKETDASQERKKEKNKDIQVDNGLIVGIFNQPTSYHVCCLPILSGIEWEYWMGTEIGRLGGYSF